MVLLPKLRQQIMVNAAQAFHTRGRVYLQMEVIHRFGGHAAWAETATRPIAARRQSPDRLAVPRLKIAHARILLGAACLLLLLALLMSQSGAPRSAPYLTYDKISSYEPAPSSMAGSPSGGTMPCSRLAAALDWCRP